MLNLLLLLLCAVTLVWVCWGAGVLARRGLGLRTPWWFQIGLGQAALGTAWTWAILAGVFRPIPVAASLILCGVLGTVLALREARSSSIGPTLEETAPTPSDHRANLLERGLLTLYFAAAILLACYPYQGSDFLSYQLPMARGYAEQGQWLWFDNLRFATFPPLMNGWFAVALMLGGPWKIPVAQLSALLPLLVLGALLIRLTRDGEPDARPVWSLALFLGSPAVAWAGIHAYVDGAMTLFMTMATWCVLRFNRDGGFTNGPVPWQWLIAAGALVGAAMNTKYLGAAFVPLLAGWLLVRWWTETGPGRSFPRLAGISLAFVGSAFVVSGPWYVTTWIRAGNPVFPFGQSVFGWAPWGWPIAPFNELQSKPGDLLATPIAWDGLSPWLLPTTALAVWAWLRRGPRLANDRGLLLSVGLGYLGLWFLMPDDRRYLLPALALLSVAGAPAVGAIARAIPGLARSTLGRTAVTGLLLLLGLAFLADQIREQGRLPPPPSETSYVEQQVPGVTALAWAEKHLQPTRVYVPDLEGVRSFARSSTVVGDWSGPWSRERLLAGIRTARDLVARLDASDVGAVLERRCRIDLREHKLRLDRWIREGLLGDDPRFGLAATSPPFERWTAEPKPPYDFTPAELDALFEEALEVVHRDGEMCVLKPRRSLLDTKSPPGGIR